MPLLLTVAIGLVAGAHAAAYGAYKDSPHESFLARRFVRELLFASVIAAALGWLELDEGESPFVLFLATFTLSRIATEFWKLFVRTEPQQDYRIPTQIHWAGAVVHNRVGRLALGFGFLASIYGVYALCTLIPADWPIAFRGMLVGIAIGTAEAMAGGYKDGTIEGFSWPKFLKSPTFGVLGGLVAAGHTSNTVSLLLATIGTMRMLLELLFKMVVPTYAPGKFRSMTGAFPEWRERRRMFLPVYTFTWGVYLVLAAHPAWPSVDLIAAEHADVAAAPLPRADECQSSLPAATERHYTVRGRIRALLVWTGRHEVGAARFAASESPSGARRLELVIGTDPDRAPMRLNRWGYVAETVCGDRASLLGLMTQSDEDTMDQATAAVDAHTRGQQFKAIRAVQNEAVVETQLLRVAFPDNPTFRELDAVLSRLPAPRESKWMTVPDSVDSGFLVALTGLLHESAVQHARTGRAVPVLVRRYVYDGKVYELTARATPGSAVAVNGRTHLRPLVGDFRIRNVTTGANTDFQIVYGSTGTVAEVPLRVTYRPRWWLELELSLEGELQ